MRQHLVAILPCNDLDAAETFFRRLGFHREGGPDEYRMLVDPHGAALHLQPAVEGWLEAARNPFGLYLYREDVDAAAAAFAGDCLHRPADMPWGMYEFAVNGPDGVLVRIGWPTARRPGAFP